jgi:4-amino-4-deoxy-L-arabinose transferase-like glycosyltransferase
MTRFERVALVGIVAVAAALRFATLGVQSLDFDEAYTVQIVGGSLGHVFRQIPVTESTPPLYYLLQWAWAQVFGLGAVGLRTLSALLGTLVVPVGFAAGRRLGGVRGGLGAALLVAVNPLMVWYSQEARSYALLSLLCALSFWAFLVALERPSVAALAGWALASAGALATHYFAGFLVGVEALWLLWLLWRRREAWRRAVPAVGAVAAAGAALVPLAVDQASHNRTEWIEALSLPARVREVGKKWLTGEIGPVASWELLLFVLVVAVLLWLALRGRRPVVFVPAAVGAAALAVSLAVDLAGAHYLISKNEMPALTVLLVALGVGLAAGRAGWAGTAVTALFFLGLAVAVDFVPSMQRPDIRDVAAAIGPRARDEVVVTPRLGDAPLAVYRPGAAPVPPGWPVGVVLLALPLPRADAGGPRPTSPAAPAGFRLAGRDDARRWSLVCYLPSSGRTVRSGRASLAALGGGAGASAQTWPRARLPSAPLPRVCGA